MNEVLPGFVLADSFESWMTVGFLYIRIESPYTIHHTVLFVRPSTRNRKEPARFVHHKKVLICMDYTYFFHVPIVLPVRKEENQGWGRIYLHRQDRIVLHV